MQDEIKNKSIFSLDDVSDEEMNTIVTETIANYNEGELVKGVIARLERDEVRVDIGYKSEGVIPAREFTIRKDANPADFVSVGDEIEAVVIRKEDQDGRLVLSKKRAEYEKAWKSVEEKYNTGTDIDGEVIEVVKGGLIVDVGLRAFLPASLIDVRRVHDLNEFIGTIITSRVIEMDKNRNNVVLSRRASLEEARRAEREEIISKIQKGMRLHGTVSSVVDFGAFVDLGGIDGLIHISELSWGHTEHPSEVVQVGDEVDVIVLHVNSERQRISLGLKQTAEDPWETFVKEHQEGAILDGEVVKIVPFGAFVNLDDDLVEGLVHVSQMSIEEVEKPEDVVSVGDKVQVRILEMDPERRRISLSMILDEKEAADKQAPSINVVYSDTDNIKVDFDDSESSETKDKSQEHSASSDDATSDTQDGSNDVGGQDEKSANAKEDEPKADTADESDKAENKDEKAPAAPAEDVKGDDE